MRKHRSCSQFAFLPDVLISSHRSLLICTWGEHGAAALELPSQRFTQCPAFDLGGKSVVEYVYLTVP